jgi:hypothetical protein
MSLTPSLKISAARARRNEVVKAELPGINQKKVEISPRGFMAGVIAPPDLLFSLSK